jgi:hypothetical protein
VESSNELSRGMGDLEENLNKVVSGEEGFKKGN